MAVKCQDVYNVLSGVQGPWRAFAVLTFANKIIKQQELVQVRARMGTETTNVRASVMQPTWGLGTCPCMSGADADANGQGQRQRDGTWPVAQARVSGVL